MPAPPSFSKDARAKAPPKLWPNTINRSLAAPARERAVRSAAAPSSTAPEMDFPPPRGPVAAIIEREHVVALERQPVGVEKMTGHIFSVAVEMNDHPLGGRSPSREPNPRELRPIIGLKPHLLPNGPDSLRTVMQHPVRLQKNVRACRRQQGQCQPAAAINGKKARKFLLPGEDREAPPQL